MGDAAHCVGICSPLGTERPTICARLQIDVQSPAHNMMNSVMGFDPVRLALGASLSTLIIVESVLPLL